MKGGLPGAPGKTSSAIAFLARGRGLRSRQPACARVRGAKIEWGARETVDGWGKVFSAPHFPPHELSTAYLPIGWDGGDRHGGATGDEDGLARLVVLDRPRDDCHRENGCFE